MSFRNIRRAILAANHRPLAMWRPRAEMISILGARIARGDTVSDDEVAGVCASSDGAMKERREMAEQLARPILIPSGSGKTAIVSFRGTVTYDLEYQPYAVSTKLFARTMRELAANDEIKRVIVMMDSPGGTVTGTAGAADATFECREKKKVTFLIDPCCCSAAYWIAAQGTELICVPDGDVGSIGVFMLHMECSKMLENDGIKTTFIFEGEFKTEGNSLEPLAESARTHWQMECGDIYADFLKAVARGRQISVAEVREKFGKGRAVSAKDAKKLGMIDRVELSEDSYRRVGLTNGEPSEGRRGEVEPRPPASALEINAEAFLGKPTTKDEVLAVGGPVDPAVAASATIGNGEPELALPLQRDDAGNLAMTVAPAVAADLELRRYELERFRL